MKQLDIGTWVKILASNHADVRTPCCGRIDSIKPEHFGYGVTTIIHKTHVTGNAFPSGQDEAVTVFVESRYLEPIEF